MSRNLFASCRIFATVTLFSCTVFSLSLPAQQPPQRDPQAIVVLTQCLNAAGGVQAFATIQDYTASGTITHFWAGQPVQGPSTLRARGAGQFRLDANLPTGTRSWAINKGPGSLRETNGTSTRIPFHHGVNAGNLSLPSLGIFAALNDPTVTVLDMGLTTISGHQAYQIRVRQNFTAAIDPKGMLSRIATKDFLIDATNYLVLETRDIVHPKDTWDEDYLHEIQFADFRVVSGVLVPFSVTEKVGGQRTWTIQLNSISFNTGLNDATFQL